MGFQEMLYELKMCGFSNATLRCFTLARKAGASLEALAGLYSDLMSE